MTSSKGALRHRFTVEIEQLKPADRALISKALAYAEGIHEGQYRKSTQYTKAEPYIVHPIKVALVICDELGITDATTICGALLHDTVECGNGKVTTGTIEKEFGRNIALMVSVLTKPLLDENVERSEQIATYHGRLSRTSINTKLVKLAERLDNMRDAQELLDSEFQIRYLKETMKVYVPMAFDTNEHLHSELVAACNKLDRTIALSSSY
jgi:(p)ppGpp synthase/HD superfamily hydrolase